MGFGEGGEFASRRPHINQGELSPVAFLLASRPDMAPPASPVVARHNDCGAGSGSITAGVTHLVIDGIHASGPKAERSARSRKVKSSTMTMSLACHHVPGRCRLHSK